MNQDTQTPHKRRVRYKGKYPKKFEEKYKELQPEKYKDTIEHVISKGNTPAGMHISIMVKEIIDFLDIVGSISNKGRRHNEHHHKVDNSVKCLACFPFEKPCIGGINTYNQNDNEQESHIESTAGKSVFGHSGKCLDTFPDTVCHVIDEVQFVGFLHHIARSIA